MATALRKLTNLEIDKVLHCFAEYSSATGQRVTRAEFEKNMNQKLQDPKFLQDLLHLLPRDNKYDLASVERDWAEVHAGFVVRLPGEPWKGHKKDKR